MNCARVKLLDHDRIPGGQSFMMFYRPGSVDSLVADFLQRGVYITQMTVRTPLAGEAAAEELFDLTNNPNREQERAKDYGSGRSISVGDIVEVAGENWLCCPVGWKKI
jgi:hypothetical protein